MKKIYRSRRERVIGGVCGGLAEHLRTDVSLIRLVWALFSIMGGAGIVLYIIAWIIIPEEEAVVHSQTTPQPQRPGSEPAAGTPEPTRQSTARAHTERSSSEPVEETQRLRWFGVILIMFGGYFIVERLLPIRISLWPILLILIGLLLLVSTGRSSAGGSRYGEPESHRPTESVRDGGTGRQTVGEEPARDDDADPDEEHPMRADEEDDEADGHDDLQRER